MSEPTMDQLLDALATLLDDFDKITRTAHARYRAYDSQILIEHDSRAQAACTYCHMAAEADRLFIDRPGIRTLDINGLRLWLVEHADVVIRFKKMDEDGRVRNYPTKQARNFDRGFDLPGLPMPPIRLTTGYLLDATGTTFVRTQIARPFGTKRTMWCAAVVPTEGRKAGERAWLDVTRQARL